MSSSFRELLKKIGSGTHTGDNLTRTESELATKMMLLAEATPAQIGAFLIAHRIKRPTPEEVAGILDAYDTLGCHLDTSNLPFDRQPVVLGNPYDGRTRTASVTPITALILADAGVPVILHGGDTMPTKYGVPSIQIWQKLGVDFSKLSLDRLQEMLAKTGLAFIYLPEHFPLAHKFVTYREEIGKRPPFATAELIWSPCSHPVHIMTGFVHPPTEDRFRETFALRGVDRFTTIKGLEGSCDLATSRTAIIGMGNGDSFDRLLLDPHNFGLNCQDVPLESLDNSIEKLVEVIHGKNSSLMPAAILNGGFYLWRTGVTIDLQSGFDLAKTAIAKGRVSSKLAEIQAISKIENN
jgi:anthranilate phosphoribosyltransferase